MPEHKDVDVNVQIQQLMTAVDVVPTKMTITFAESTVVRVTVCSETSTATVVMSLKRISTHCHIGALQSNLCHKGLSFGTVVKGAYAVHPVRKICNILAHDFSVIYV